MSAVRAGRHHPPLYVQVVGTTQVSLPAAIYVFTKILQKTTKLPRVPLEIAHTAVVITRL